MSIDVDATTAANALVEEHLYLVQHVVNQLACRFPRHVDREELWSAGAAGLVDAARRFDVETGIPFERYAVIRIRGSIIDATRTRDWATRSVRRNVRALNGATAGFEEQHGRTPSAAELADRLGVDVDEVDRRRAAAQRATLLHLDRPLGGDNEHETLADLLAERDSSILPDEAVEHRELSGTITVAIAALPDMQREVIERSFFGGELLRDIAESLHVTEARVSQLRTEAIQALQAYFATLFEGVEAVPEDAPGKRARAAYLARLTESTTWQARMDAEPSRSAVSA